MLKRKSIKLYSRTLSDRESTILSNLSFSGKNIFTTNDLKQYDVAKPKNLLDSLVRKRWILKIRKGVYAIVPLEAGESGAANYTVHSFVIASLLVKPYYIGYWSALNYHGFTDQTPAAVYIATTKPRNSRRILDTEFKFVTLPAQKIFGAEEVEIEKRKIIVSDVEKTIVDCLDHPEHCGGGVEEVAKALYFSKDDVDFKKLVAYAVKLGNTAVLKRLGYLAEALGFDDWVELLLKAKLGEGYALLDPALPRKGRIKERWKLIVNATVDADRWSA